MRIFLLPMLIALSAAAVVKTPFLFTLLARDFARDPWLREHGVDRKLFEPGLAREAFPEVAWEALALLESAGCLEFALSPLLTNNETWLQRLTEGAFPRRRKLQSRWQLHLPSERLGANCHDVGQSKEVKLALCD